MAVLQFSIASDAVGRISEALVCLAKFGDSVYIEARSDRFTLTTLNSSQTAYASFAFDRDLFFNEYEFDANYPSISSEHFTCQLLNKALQSVFKSKPNDARGRELGLDRCDVIIEDATAKTECRLVIKMISKQGMIKTYRLTYESTNVMHALFDKTSATQGWRISSRVLREYIEFFGPRTEQLDLLAQDGKAIFTSFTEKIQDGKEVLKQPLETAVAIPIDDFDDFHAQESMHIVISVKDFRAVVVHAETLRTSISAHFSSPSRPLQFSYQSSGINCAFTLMTTGNSSSTGTTQVSKFVTTRSASRQPTAAPTQQSERTSFSMPPPAPRSMSRSLASQNQRPSLRQQAHAQTSTASDPDPDSLFIPDHRPADDDKTWDPQGYDGDADGETLGWDASMEQGSATHGPTIQDSEPGSGGFSTNRNLTQWSQEGLEPTQRLSQLHGMFD